MDVRRVWQGEGCVASPVGLEVAYFDAFDGHDAVRRGTVDTWLLLYLRWSGREANEPCACESTSEVIGPGDSTHVPSQLQATQLEGRELSLRCCIGLKPQSLFIILVLWRVYKTYLVYPLDKLSSPKPAEATQTMYRLLGRPWGGIDGTQIQPSKTHLDVHGRGLEGLAGLSLNLPS